jgi:hypothetical protein
MKRKQLMLCESEYFNDKEGAIQLQPESCSQKGIACEQVIRGINKNLVLTRKFAEKKEYTRALNEIKEAHTSTFNLSTGTCLDCAQLFRQIILSQLEQTISELEKMTHGLFARKSLQYDLEEANKLYSELKMLK